MDESVSYLKIRKWSQKVNQSFLLVSPYRIKHLKESMCYEFCRVIAVLFLLHIPSYSRKSRVQCLRRELLIPAIGLFSFAEIETRRNLSDLRSS
jgi:hypothetical protein